MSSFSAQTLQEKLNRLTLSQDSIETLSLWVIHHKDHARTSVSLWLDSLQKADADHRLTLFYLANDILQNGRRRGTNLFFALFQDPLRQAVALARGQKIQTSVERMFRIWKERKVYDGAFLKELELLIGEGEPTKVKPQKENHPPPAVASAEFKLSILEDAMTELRKFGAEMKVKSSHLANLRMDVSDTSDTLTKLKDKSEGSKFSSDFEEASQKLQDYCECLGIEVKERTNILDMLQSGRLYYARCLTEFKRTAEDYKQLGVVVESVKEKLHQRLKELQRAQQTATSDPSAKEDITEEGDMEIDSDNEIQEGVEVAAKGPPPPSLQNMPAPRPMMAAPPPGRFVPMLSPAFRPPMYSHEPRPSLPFPPRTSFVPPMMLRPRLPLPPNSQMPPRARMPPPPPHQGVPPNQKLEMNTISAPPMKYMPPVSTVVQDLSESVPEGDSEISEASPTADQPSLDERLKNLMSHKTFPKTLLDYSDSESEGERDPDTEKPYSPTADNILTGNSGTPLDKDDDSIPTPTTETPTPDLGDSSPQMNMDNPILQVLYKSQEVTPKSEKPPSPSQPSNPIPKSSILSDVDTGLLQNILNNVTKSVANNQSASHQTPPAVVQRRSSEPPGNSLPNAPSVDPAPPTHVEPKGRGIPNVKTLKMTPSLTSLLDNIFPQLSKSLLMERKRKLEGAPPTEPKQQKLDSPSDPNAPKGLGPPPPNPSALPPFGSPPPPRPGPFPSEPPPPYRAPGPRMVPPPGRQLPPPGRQLPPPGRQFPPPGRPYLAPNRAPLPSGRAFPPPSRAFPPGQFRPPPGRPFPPQGPPYRLPAPQINIRAPFPPRGPHPPTERILDGPLLRGPNPAERIPGPDGPLLRGPNPAERMPGPDGHLLRGPNPAERIPGPDGPLFRRPNPAERIPGPDGPLLRGPHPPTGRIPGPDGPLLRGPHPTGRIPGPDGPLLRGPHPTERMPGPDGHLLRGPHPPTGRMPDGHLFRGAHPTSPNFSQTPINQDHFPPKQDERIPLTLHVSNSPHTAINPQSSTMPTRPRFI